jgi:branched-chain amino acid transport system ATP-binding protein
MLEIRGLTAGYGDRMVLSDLDLTVAAGERVSLIGHNGAGKSTILKAITGQIRPRGGTISYRGQRTDGLPPEAMVKRGVIQVPAGRRVFPQLTVRQNLSVGAFARSDRAEVQRDIEALLDRFAVLRRKERSRAGTLSGGEQQMLAIARALMGRPTLLMVDEPSLGLSPIMVDEVFSLLAGLAESGIILILAEQNVRKALTVTDRAILLTQGAVTAEMPSAELLSNTDFRRAYLGAGA